jgi:serine/threonine-protein kinase
LGVAQAVTAKRVGPYELEEELGRGAFGVVYRAHHRDRPEAPLAVKVVESRGPVDRLLLEPALLAKLNHPCIVRLEDYFLEGDRLVLAMEYVPGDDLKTCVERGETFGPAAVRELLVQMAAALETAHAHNVVHRDIKLGNILVDRTGPRMRFVLTDFGIGRTAEGIQTQKHAGGTFAFMAPEQLRGRPCPQSDLWALGVVAYRLLTGKMPFAGQTLAELSSQIFYATPPPPSKSAAGPVDAELEAVVFHLLEKSLSERTASASELLRELGYAGRAGTVLERAGREAAAPRVPLDERLRRQVARYRALVAAVVVLYALTKGFGSGALLLAGVALFYRSQERRARAGGRGRGAAAAALALLAASAALQYSGHDLSMAHVLQWVTQRVSLPVAPARDEGGLRLLVALLLTALVVLAGIAYGLLGLVLPPLGAWYYSALRRQQRTQAMRRAALESGEGPDRYLATMRGFLDYRFEDVGFHLKYAEALLARGRAREVAVEAKLLLLQDPYNFNGNLLLANAYYALGLHEDCAAVCDAYLAVAGHCFEFGELRQQCARQLGGAA